MNFKRVHVIVNPASGRDQPILKTLNGVFHAAGISATFFAQDTEGLKVLGAENVFVTSQPGASSKEAYEKAQQLIHP